MSGYKHGSPRQLNRNGWIHQLAPATTLWRQKSAETAKMAFQRWCMCSY